MHAGKIKTVSLQVKLPLVWITFQPQSFQTVLSIDPPLKMLSSHFLKLVGLASLTGAHFFLETPIAIGFDDLTLTEAPCGGFDPTDRSAGVTEWSVLGYPIALITTHLNVNWTFRAALLSDVTNWVDVFPRIHQTGIAEFCLPEVPGIEAWIGQDAVVQIIQEAPDGLLHQVRIQEPQLQLFTKESD